MRRHGEALERLFFLPQRAPAQLSSNPRTGTRSDGNSLRTVHPPYGQAELPVEAPHRAPEHGLLTPRGYHGLDRSLAPSLVPRWRTTASCRAVKGRATALPSPGKALPPPLGADEDWQRGCRTRQSRRLGGLDGGRRALPARVGPLSAAGGKSGGQRIAGSTGIWSCGSSPRRAGGLAGRPSRGGRCGAATPLSRAGVRTPSRDCPRGRKNLAPANVWGDYLARQLVRQFIK